MNRFSKHCDQCGTALPLGDEWPKKCLGCGRGVWPNPTPIGVCLVPVSDGNRVGILIGKRGHNPGMGEWGLPGGFINDTVPGETIIGGATRELWEETGVDLRNNYDRFSHHWEYANDPQAQVLVFYHYPYALGLGTMVSEGPCSFTPECTELRVAWHPESLCFSSHTIALNLWFVLRTAGRP